MLDTEKRIELIPMGMVADENEYLLALWRILITALNAPVRSTAADEHAPEIEACSFIKSLFPIYQGASLYKHTDA